ncbi:hypothetical protein ACNQ6O_15025 [Marinobacter sp. SBS5]|uniref:hypothetical protein n=1 Tax=Marinobacter sp. SBS5 TaxID=3401754 RepID=UPI003AB01A23
MNTKRPTEKELLDGLIAHTAHADQLAEPLQPAATEREAKEVEALIGRIQRGIPL